MDIRCATMYVGGDCGCLLIRWCTASFCWNVSDSACACVRPCVCVRCVCVLRRPLRRPLAVSAAAGTAVERCKKMPAICLHYFLRPTAWTVRFTRVLTGHWPSIDHRDPFGQPNAKRITDFAHTTTYITPVARRAKKLDCRNAALDGGRKNPTTQPLTQPP